MVNVLIVYWLIVELSMPGSDYGAPRNAACALHERGVARRGWWPIARD